MSVKLKPNAAVTYAKDFTSLAIEKGLIYATTDATESAENVITFFNTIYDSLTSGEAQTNDDEQ